MSFENEALDNTTSDEVDDSSNNLHADNEVLDNLASDSMDDSLNNSDNLALDNLASDSMNDSSSDEVLDASTNIQVSLDILHADNMVSDNMQLDNMQSSSDNMASDTMTSNNMAQIEDETNLYKGKLISVGRNMQTPSKIRVVPPIRIDMAKKKLISVKRKLQMIKNK
ncbi:hypothetical protein TNCV_565691 [Trichonephila clavipes]|nr:hypothetical protein TNCV_565691 [Trichonephila clavipes]